MYHAYNEGSNNIGSEGLHHLSKAEWPKINNLWLSITNI
jgi:hypothetical protein